MVQEREEKPSAKQDWSPDELQRLYNVAKDFAKKTKRIVSWDKLIKDYFPWDEVDLENRTKEETKDVLMELFDKQYVRHYRLLNELIDDLAEKAEQALPPFIPDPPKKPYSTFMLYSMAQQKKIRERNPDSDLGAIGKIVGESYQSLSEKKKKKLGERHQQLMGEYHKDCEEYLSKYPQMIPVLRGERKTKQPFAPPKQPTSMYVLICQDVRTKMKEELGRDVTFKEAQQRVGKKYQNSLSPEEKKHYEEIYAESMKKYEQELADFRARHPEAAAEGDAKKMPEKKKTKQKEKAAKKEIVASDSEDSDFIEPKTKKSKSTVTQAKKIQDVNETDLKKEKLKSNDSEEEKSATKKKKSEEEKINGKAHKRKETESEDSDSENEEPPSKPAMKPANHTKRQRLEKKQIDLKGIDSEDSHEVRTKKSQTKKLMVSAKAYENDAEPNLKVTTSTPKSTVSLARKIPPELDSSDETDEETDDVKSSTGKPGNGERNIQSVKLQRNKDSSSESEEDGSEQLNKEPAKKKDESADSDNTTPSPLPVKSTKNARDNLKKKVQKGQKTYLSVSEMKRLEYNELIDALKKAVPGFPVRSSLGALDVFMEIYPITRDLQNARKKFKRLEPKEQEEIISMYRQEQHDYEKRIKQFFGDLDKEERAFLKLAAPVIAEKMEAIAIEHSVEGQSEDED